MSFSVIKKYFRDVAELKYFRLSNSFLAIFVQSDDFCYFSSRKSRQTVSAPILFLRNSQAIQKLNAQRVAVAFASFGQSKEGVEHPTQSTFCDIPSCHPEPCPRLVPGSIQDLALPQHPFNQIPNLLFSIIEVCKNYVLTAITLVR